MKRLHIYLILICFHLSCVQTMATQTIFNVPSADVTPEGKVFVQQEAQIGGIGNDDFFFDGTTFSALGIGHNTEVVADLFNVGAPPSRNISMGFGFKSAIPIAGLKEKFPEREFKFTVGSMVLTSLEGNGVGNWTFAHVSGRVPKANTRLTAGLSYGTKQVFGVDSLAFIAGVEQPITKRLNLIGDWYSGSEHWAGFLILGGSYALPKNMTVYAGYQIPNTPNNGAPGVVVELSKIF